MNARYNKHYVTSILLTVLFALFSFASLISADASSELIIKYRPGKQLQSVSTASISGLKITKNIGKIRVNRVKLPDNADVQDAIEKIKRNPNVEYVGINHKIHICKTPDDDIYVNGLLDVFTQWGLDAIDAPLAWDITTGDQNVIIAIVDTGVESSHEDLAGKLITGTNTISGAVATDTEDDNGHGTFTAGIAAASTNNSIGIAGVSWNSKIMPVKVIDSSGEGSEADAAEGIIWAADHGANIINMSFGGYDNVPAEKAAIDYAYSKGCILIAASGNDGSTDDFYPACYDNVLSVGASDEENKRCTSSDWGSGGSNYGSYLDVIAPGNNIVSTTNEDSGLWGPYTINSGTSAAAPLVSGIAALVLSKYPTWTNDQVMTQIKMNCTDVSPVGWDQETGWGVVNAYNALVNPPLTSSKIGDLNNMTIGKTVQISNAVVTSGSPDLLDRIYVEQKDRSCGIMLPFSTMPIGFSEGDTVNIIGSLATVNGELAIQGATLTKTGTTTPISPLAMQNKSIGGAGVGIKSGIDNGTGINNVGLLVTAWGKVTTVSNYDYFYIDDGSNLDNGSGLTGLKIYSGTLVQPSKGDYVRITGISSIEQPHGTTNRISVVRARRQKDILILK